MEPEQPIVSPKSPVLLPAVSGNCEFGPLQALPPRVETPNFSSEPCWAAMMKAAGALFDGVMRSLGVPQAYVPSLEFCGTRPPAEGLAPEEYQLVITDRIRIDAGGLPGLVHAMTTLLQLVQTNEQADVVLVPRCVIDDYPFAPHRGLLVDVARKPHTLRTLKALVLLCRWYKLNVLHIHFSDNQGWCLPSRAFPRLGAWYRDRRRRFSPAEVADLRAFAMTHCVTLLPEIDMPGHARALLSAQPKEFGIRINGKLQQVIHPAREETYASLRILIHEVCSLFPESPMIHLGADEAGFEALWGHSEVIEYTKKHGLGDPAALYRHFITRVCEMVVDNGKQPCVWEGFSGVGEPIIPRTVPVFEFESLYNLPPDVHAAGYSLVNTSWQPLYITHKHKWSPAQIYEWNMFRWENWNPKSPAHETPFQLPPDARVLGAQVCSWNNRDRDEIALFRERAAALAENVWTKHKALATPGSVTPEHLRGFQERLAAANQRVDAILNVL